MRWYGFTLSLENVAQPPMETEALKNDLIEWIQRLQDRGILESLAMFKKGAVSQDWADDLSGEARSSIERGLEDVRMGRVMGSDEFWSQLRGRFEGRVD